VGSDADADAEAEVEADADADVEVEAEVEADAEAGAEAAASEESEPFLTPSDCSGWPGGPGAVVMGPTAVRAAVQQGEARLILFAADAAEGQLGKVDGGCFGITRCRFDGSPTG
jgi:hypothetical protein